MFKVIVLLVVVAVLLFGAGSLVTTIRQPAQAIMKPASQVVSAVSSNLGSGGSGDAANSGTTDGGSYGRSWDGRFTFGVDVRHGNQAAIDEAEADRIQAMVPYEQEAADIENKDRAAVLAATQPDRIEAGKGVAEADLVIVQSGADAARHADKAKTIRNYAWAGACLALMAALALFAVQKAAMKPTTDLVLTMTMPRPNETKSGWVVIQSPLNSLRNLPPLLTHKLLPGVVLTPPREAGQAVVALPAPEASDIARSAALADAARSAGKQNRGQQILDSVAGLLVGLQERARRPRITVSRPGATEAAEPEESGK